MVLDTIAADLAQTLARAAVTELVIAVIASLITFLSWRSIIALNTAAARSDSARCGIARRRCRHHKPHCRDDTITARRRRTGAQTGIGFNGVAVVTALAVLQHTIAALAAVLVAVIGRVFVAVVTAPPG